VLDSTQFSGADDCAKAQAAFGTTVGGLGTVIVDSRAALADWVSGGIPCATPPAPTGIGGEWLLPSGPFVIQNPVIIEPKEKIVGACIAYDIAHCSGFEASNSAWVGGLGGLNQGAYPAGSPYYSGEEVTNGGSTWYAVYNNFSGQTPSTSTGNYWTLASQFPSPVAQTNMLGTGNDQESMTLSDLGLWCQYSSAGSQTVTYPCVGYLNTDGQEQTIAGPLKIRDATVAGMWFNNPLVSDSGPFGPLTIGYDAGGSNGFNNACGAVAGGDVAINTSTISSVTAAAAAGGGYMLTINLSGAPANGPFVGTIAEITSSNTSLSNIPASYIDEVATARGLWVVWSVQSLTQFTVMSATSITCPSSCGTVNFYPNGLNVSYDATHSLAVSAGFHRITVNSSTCNTAHTNYSYFPPLGIQFAGGNSPLYDSHVEGHRVGACIGCFGPSQGEQLINFAPLTNVYTGVLIDNKYSVTAADLEGVICGTNSGPNHDHYCLIDLVNGNLITLANNPYIQQYKMDASGFPHALLANCADMSNGWCDDGTKNVLKAGGVTLYSVVDATGVTTLEQINQSASNSFAGSCTMSASTTCTFAAAASYTNYLSFPSIDHSSAPPATAISANCSFSSGTVTITAGASNSLKWDCMLVGNPN